MFSVPLVYSVYSRVEFIKYNLDYFKKIGFNKITFLVDSAPKTDFANLKCISLVTKFCKEMGCKIVRKRFNYGGYCMFTNFYSNTNLDLSHYHALIEDDFILSDSFMKFHQLVYDNFEKFNNYGAIVPFGFNIGENKFKLLEIDPSCIEGCLWGAGYNNKLYLPLYQKSIYKTYNINYLDSIVLNYFSDIKKKILVTSHNLISYCGFKDSRDKERLITCMDYPNLFNSNTAFDSFSLEIDNSLSSQYIDKYKFFARDCKDC